jgi:hypothetical protein
VIGYAVLTCFANTFSSQPGNPKKRKISATRSESKRQDTKIGMGADALSSSLSDPRYRIQSLEATLQILRETQDQVQKKVKAKEKESAVDKASVSNKPETKEPAKYVSFVNWEEEEKYRKESIQARREKLKEIMEAAKSEEQKAEMERERVRTLQVMESSSSHDQAEDGGEDEGGDEAENKGEHVGGNGEGDDGEDEGEDEEDSDGEDDGDSDGEDGGEDDNQDDPSNDSNTDDTLYVEEGESEDEDEGEDE